MILDGYETAKKIRQNLRKEIKKEKIKPKLAIIQIGENENSHIYIKNKWKACEEVGISYEYIHEKETIEEETLLKKIQELNEDKSIHGIMIQRPLPKHLNETKLDNAIKPEKDVEGLSARNIKALWDNEEGFVPCTPKGILRLLKEYQIKIEGKNVVILGRSNIVGKPLAHLFLNENASVTMLHSKSQKIEEYTTHADILVSAVGIPNFITKEMVKPKSIIIDVGITKKDGHILGDVDFDTVKNIASYITPVPKGIGPMTITMLLENVVKACKLEQKNKEE